MVTDASSPFDHPKADIILRTADNVDFRVFKLFLSLASPFFETMFELPQPSPEASGDELKDGLPVIPVTEDSMTLNTLLRFCYPSTLADDPDLNNLNDLVPVLEAAKKYSLELIEKKVGVILGNPAILEKEPFRAFAIACHSMLERETRVAAKYTLGHDLIPPFVKELQLITATDLRQLIQYRIKCATEVGSLASLQWIDNKFKNSMMSEWFTDSPTKSFNYHSQIQSQNGPHDHYQTHNGGLKCPLWFSKYLDVTFALLQNNNRPAGAVVAEETEKAVAMVRKCVQCGKGLAHIMTEFASKLTDEVEKAVAKVELDMTGMTVSGGFLLPVARGGTNNVRKTLNSYRSRIQAA